MLLKLLKRVPTLRMAKTRFKVLIVLGGLGVGPLRSIRVVSTSLRTLRTRRAPGMLPRAAETLHWLPELVVHAPHQFLGTLLSNTGRVHQSVEVMDFGPLHWRHELPARATGVHTH